MRALCDESTIVWIAVLDENLKSRVRETLATDGLAMVYTLSLRDPRVILNALMMFFFLLDLHYKSFFQVSLDTRELWKSRCILSSYSFGT